MKEQFVDLICKRLNSEIDSLRERFQASNKKIGVRFVAIDDLLPIEIVGKIHEEFPTVAQMRLMDSFKEKKYTSKNFGEFFSIISDITFAFHDPRVIALVERITNISNQIPDPHMYAGGLSSMLKGHYLNPHIDNSHDGDRQVYRTLNLLYYVTPDWKLEYGGNLELWDKSVKNKQTIICQFNRLVLMETNPWSWHSVSPVTVDKNRCCISNYYFSPVSPIGVDYFNVTSFSARPEQRFLRALSFVDNKLRKAVRKIFPYGIGKNDIYGGGQSK